MWGAGTSLRFSVSRSPPREACLRAAAQPSSSTWHPSYFWCPRCSVLPATSRPRGTYYNWRKLRASAVSPSWDFKRVLFSAYFKGFAASSCALCQMPVREDSPILSGVGPVSLRWLPSLRAVAFALLLLFVFYARDSVQGHGHAPIRVQKSVFQVTLELKRAFYCAEPWFFYTQ